MEMAWALEGYCPYCGQDLDHEEMCAACKIWRNGVPFFQKTATIGKIGKAFVPVAGTSMYDSIDSSSEEECVHYRYRAWHGLPIPTEWEVAAGTQRARRYA